MTSEDGLRPQIDLPINVYLGHAAKAFLSDGPIPTSTPSDEREKEALRRLAITQRLRQDIAEAEARDAALVRLESAIKTLGGYTGGR